MADHAFVNRPFYGAMSQERLRLILGALDYRMQLDHPMSEHPAFDYDALQIEHILPRSWTQHWPVITGDESRRPLLEQTRDRAVNKMGNLTLVTRPLNPSMSNGAWTDKRPALREHAKLEITAMAAARQTWDEEAIEERGRRFGKLACRVWPRPSH